MPEPMITSLSDYPDRFLSCRTINHPWSEDGLPWVDNKDGVPVVYQKFTCPRCNCGRTDQRTMQGRLLRRAYRPPSTYRLHPDLRVGEQLHAERIHRLLRNIQPQTQAV